MMVTLTPVKANNLVSYAKDILKKEKVVIRDLAKMKGKILVAFPAVKFGPLHYCKLEQDNKQKKSCTVHPQRF